VLLGSAESIRDLAEDIGDLRTDQHQDRDNDNGNQNQNQCVLYQTLTLLAREIHGLTSWLQYIRIRMEEQ
jgi:hypothetical protein